LEEKFTMAINLLTERGQPLDRQQFTWKDLVRNPISKLDDDAFTRVRTILMNGVELDSLRVKQIMLRSNGPLRVPIAQLMRAEQHQATLINWLIGADHSPIETTIGYEQTAIEVTAAVAQMEPDEYLAQGYRYALLEDFDHLYRYSALLDRLEGKDANNITQGHTDIVPARPTLVHHRAAEHDLLEPYEADAALATKLHALTLTGGEYQTHDYYMNIGPLFTDPLARQLYAEIASVESQHIVHYGSMINPDESPLEKLLLQEACEVWNYSACVEQESNPRIKAIWERFLDYELGHLQAAIELFKQHARRDPAELLGDGTLPPRIAFKSHRDFVRQVIANETAMRKDGTRFVDEPNEGKSSLAYRQQMNRDGSPSQTVSATYRWAPGTELTRAATASKAA
jgi:rubrerythrin